MTPTDGELGRLARDHGWRVEDRATLSDGVWVGQGGGAAEAFDAAGHRTLREVEERSLWFLSRNDLIEDLLRGVGMPAALWELGAGNGFVSLHLQRAGIPVVAVEPGVEGARTAAERGVREVVCASLAHLALPDACLPAVGMFDVIEHLERPDRLLSEVRRVLLPDGLLAVSVPAFPALWSDADELAGHRRRYRRAELSRDLAAVGFRPLHVGYRFAAAMPPVAIQRVLGRALRKRPPRDEAAQWEKLERQLAGQSRVTVGIGRRVMAGERRWTRRLPVPFGTSVFAIARR